MVPSVRHFESLTLWIQLHPGLRDRARKVTNGHSRKLTKLSMTIFSKFWLRDRYPICVHGSRPRCFTCIAEQVSSEVVDIFLGGGRPLACHFTITSVRNGQIGLFSFEDIILLTVDPGRVIFNHRDSSRQLSVQQFAEWISLIPPRLIIRFQQIIFHRC